MYETVKVNYVSHNHKCDVTHNHKYTDGFLSLKQQDVNVPFLNPSFFSPKPQGIFLHFASHYSIKVILHVFRPRVACTAFLLPDEHEPLTGVTLQ